MTINSIAKLQVLNKESAPSKDGTKTYYRIAFLQGMDAGNITLPEETYHSIEVGKTYDFHTAYNDQYKSFSIRGLATVPTSAGSDSKASAPAK